MDRLRPACIAILILLASAPLAAAFAADATTPTQAPTPSATTPPADDPNTVICRHGEPVLGSRLPGPTQCHNKREWDARRQRNMDTLTRLQTDSGAGGLGGGMGGR